MERELERMIEIFVWIALRGIGRQKEQLDFIPMPVQPGRSFLPMVYFQIVQNQENLLAGGPNQPVHKLDQPLLIHGILIQHKTNVPLPAQGGKHIQPLSFRLHWQNRGLPLGCKPALTV